MKAVIGFLETSYAESERCQGVVLSFREVIFRNLKVDFEKMKMVDIRAASLPHPGPLPLGEGASCWMCACVPAKY
jgi:hypothetical protein